MSLSEEAADLADKREAVFHRLGEKLEKLIHHVRNANFEQGTRYNELGKESDEARLCALEDEIALAEAILEIQRKLDAAERRIAELRQWEPDLSLYGKGEPKSLEELKASHDRLLCTCPRDSTLIEKSCPVHGGWFPQGECTCPPEWTAQCRSSACPRNRTKNTRDWL